MCCEEKILNGHKFFIEIIKIFELSDNDLDSGCTEDECSSYLIREKEIEGDVLTIDMCGSLVEASRELNPLISKSGCAGLDSPLFSSKEYSVKLYHFGQDGQFVDHGSGVLYLDIKTREIEHSLLSAEDDDVGKIEVEKVELYIFAERKSMEEADKVTGVPRLRLHCEWDHSYHFNHSMGNRFINWVRAVDEEEWCFP